jgi:hypothetical protein
LYNKAKRVKSYKKDICLFRIFFLSIWITVILCLTTLRGQVNQSQETPLEQIRKYRNWRAAWGIDLAVTPDSVPVPDSVFIRLENRSSDSLKGSNLLLCLYPEITYAFHTEIREKEIKLVPGDTLSFRLAFRSLVFVDSRGKPADTARLFDLLRTGVWRMKCSLTDLWSPKPLNESTLLVTSWLLEFNTDK